MSNINYKYLFVKIFYVFLGVVLISGIIYFSLRLFYNERMMYHHARAQRYFSTNIEKNWGVRKEILKMASSVNRFLYNPQIVRININLEEPGASRIYQEEKFDFNNIEFAGNEVEILDKMRNAEPGTAIIIKPGDYYFQQHNLQIGNAGTKENRIALMGLEFGDVTFYLYSLEGLYINKPNWLIKNIRFVGVCAEHFECEHAIHIVPGGDGTYVYNNVFKNFNSHIKVNGAFSEDKNAYMVVNDLKVVNNTFYNENYRNVTSAVTPIDIVGGERHLIESNIITDFSRKISSLNTSWTYGAFIKGESSNGIIKDNIVACSYLLPYQSALDARVGLSFGGGGTADRYCPGSKCDYEHKNGTLKRNYIYNCFNDSSVYINKSISIEHEDNYFINSLAVGYNK